MHFVHSSCMDVCLGLLQDVCHLQNVGRILREMNSVGLHDKRDTTGGGGDMMETPCELRDLASISIDRDRENRTLRKILLLAKYGNCFIL